MGGFYFFFLPFLISLLATPLVIKLAFQIGCIDRPGQRRFHARPTPRLGGVAVFLGVLPVFFLLPVRSDISFFLAGAFLLLILGAIDDRQGLGWKIKFTGIICATALAIFGGDAVIRQVGTFRALGSIKLGELAIPFTFFAVVGLTNALNLIDGLNGLATGIAMIGFFFMGGAATLVGNTVLAKLSMGYLGALAGFLFFNFPKARIFMGDSGSLFIGYSLGIFAILLTQTPERAVEPLFPVIVLLIPVFDAVRVMSVRIMKSKNPFKADKIHIHHLLVRRIYTPLQTVMFIWGLCLFFGVTATLILRQGSTPFLVVGILSFVMLSLYTDILSRMKRKKKRSIEMPVIPTPGQG